MADWNGSDTFFLVAGVVQAILALGAFLFLVAWVLAVSAYLGVGPGAMPAFLFTLWGLVSGIMLAARRTVAASRAAAFWYLPIGLLFVGFSFWNPVKHVWPTVENIYSFFGGLVLLLIFAMLVKPIVPGRAGSEEAFNREESR